MPSSIKKHRIASLSDLRTQKRLACECDGHSILLIERATSVVAIENTCTHLGLSLERGRIIAGHIYCPHHGACFDLTTGEALSGPAVSPIRRYETMVRGDDIYVAIEA